VRQKANKPAAAVQPEKEAAPPPAQPAAQGSGFSFPNDKAGRLVAELLRPSEEAFAARSAGPKSLRALSWLEHPEVPLPPCTGQFLRSAPAPVARPARPRALPEELPLTHTRADGRLPEKVELPAGSRIKVPALDVKQPPPLPILAQPVPDRGPLGDPSGPASLKAALAAAAPVRTAPAPFDRPSIPDPFEHRQTVRLATPPAEAPAPPQVLPPTPPLTLPEKGR
jgi:hypothetical protein